MILVFKNGEEEIVRHESPYIPKKDDEIKLDNRHFVVNKIVYEFYGSNNAHLAEVFMDELES
jgi:hypothetical protein